VLPLVTTQAPAVQGLRKINMLNMCNMLNTDFATSCYSPGQRGRSKRHRCRPPDESPGYSVPLEGASPSFEDSAGGNPDRLQPRKRGSRSDACSAEEISPSSSPRKQQRRTGPSDSAVLWPYYMVRPRTRLRGRPGGDSGGTRSSGTVTTADGSPERQPLRRGGAGVNVSAQGQRVN
jgi:hypothetical protein